LRGGTRHPFPPLLSLLLCTGCRRAFPLTGNIRFRSSRRSLARWSFSALSCIELIRSSALMRSATFLRRTGLIRRRVFLHRSVLLAGWRLRHRSPDHSSCNRTHLVPFRERELPLNTRRAVSPITANVESSRREKSQKRLRSEIKHHLSRRSLREWSDWDERHGRLSRAGSGRA